MIKATSWILIFCPNSKKNTFTKNISPTQVEKVYFVAENIPIC